MHARRWMTALTAACVSLLFGAEALQAQNGPPDIPPGLHDRTPPPPFGGEPGDPPGLGNMSVLSPRLVPAVADAATGVDAALRSGSFGTAQGPALTPEVQGTVHALLTGDEKASGHVKTALLEPGNRGAKAEAEALSDAARGLLSAPERLPAALRAHNALVMASSADFLRNPPEEFLTLHAALHELAEAAMEAEAAREAEETAPPARGAL